MPDGSPFLSRRDLFKGGVAGFATAALAGWTTTPGLAGSRTASVTAPAPLRRGAHLRAVNPGTWMDPETDFTVLQQRCALEGWTLEVPGSVKGQWRYFSARDRDRVADLQKAWLDPSVDAVITLGGGWGGARVLEAGFRFPRRAKWCLGFSDTSSLLLAQWAAGLPGAVHGSSGGDDRQWQRTVDLLTGRPVAPLKGTALRSVRASQLSRVSGPLVVTNLTVATHLIGTPWFPDLRGAVLVLEDVGEAPYRVDRMLTQWRSAGLLKAVVGIGCGRFSWAEDDILPGDFSMEEVLEERLGDLGIPVLLDLPVGHGRPNMALPLGRRAVLDTKRASLTLL